MKKADPRSSFRGTVLLVLLMKVAVRASTVRSGARGGSPIVRREVYVPSRVRTGPALERQASVRGCVVVVVVLGGCVVSTGPPQVQTQVVLEVLLVLVTLIPVVGGRLVVVLVVVSVVTGLVVLLLVLVVGTLVVVDVPTRVVVVVVVVLVLLVVVGTPPKRRSSNQTSASLNGRPVLAGIRVSRIRSCPAPTGGSRSVLLKVHGYVPPGRMNVSVPKSRPARLRHSRMVRACPVPRFFPRAVSTSGVTGSRRSV